MGGVSKQPFFVKAYLIKYFRYPLSTYFCFNPFNSPYTCFDIQLGLVNKFSVYN